MRHCSTRSTRPTRSTCSATFCHQLVTTVQICLQEDQEAEPDDALSVAVLGAEVRQKEAELAAAKGSFDKEKARYLPELAKWVEVR